MAASTVSSYSSWLVDMWSSKATIVETLTDNVTFGMVEKDTAWRGGPYHLTLGFGDEGGHGADFGTAQRNKSPSSEAEFQLTPATYYSLFSISRQAMRRATSKGAVIEILGHKTKSSLNAWKRKNGLYLFGDGTGSLATVVSTSTTDLVLSSEDEARRFEPGETVTLSTSGGTARDGEVKILRVDVANKKLVASGTWTDTISGITAGDLVYIAGTKDAVIKGFKAWLPTTVTATSFFGLDRTQHSTRLGGLYSDLSALSPRAAARRAALEVYKNGGKADWSGALQRSRERARERG
jgi:hypothetical protein